MIQVGHFGYGCYLVPVFEEKSVVVVGDEPEGHICKCGMPPYIIHAQGLQCSHFFELRYICP